MSRYPNTRPVFTTAAGMPNPRCGCSRIALAMRIARMYRDNIPAPSALMSDFGMSRATAYRWIAALKAVA